MSTQAAGIRPAETAALPSPGSVTGGSLASPYRAALATVLAVVGVFAVYSTASYLWSLWVNDPLKSIGGLIPLVSLVLILRAWHALGWEMRGTWWGFVILAGTVALVHLRDHAILEFILSPSWAIFLPPHSLVALLYTVGVVLLFGGTRLLRTALFPVLLTWFVNPIPHVFNLWVDLPLQHASAHIARAFAHALGQPLTPDQLRLMFTPEFGMFIAPGCNGIRGAVTMGFLALVAGYVYRFRLRWHVLAVLGAVALGYVFNFVRLCVLVLYYIVALHMTWLQSRAEMGDYIIGACLFLFATFLLFTVILRLSPTGTLRPPPVDVHEPVLDEAAAEGDEAAVAKNEAAVAKNEAAVEEERPAGMWHSFGLRLAAFALLVGVGSVSYVRAMAAGRHQPQAITDPQKLGQFPQKIGNYTLDRAWNEYLVTGALIFYWAEYAPEGGGAHVAVGISPVLGAHDTLLCHSARGEDWLWHDTLAFRTAGDPTSFSASFYNDGATQYMEATTVCTGTHCGQYASNRQHFGLIYSRPDTRTLLTQSPTRPIPVLLRTETLDTAMAADKARDQLAGNLRRFLAAADLSAFTAPYR